MADPAGLLSSTEDELKSIAAEIKHLGQKAESAWQAYQGAERGQKTDAKEYWQAAVRDKEAARRDKEKLEARMNALIEKLPAAGELSVKSKMLIQIP